MSQEFPSFQSYYDYLKLESDATEEAITKAYRMLAREYHPDRNPDADPEIFIQINKAYDILKNEQYREHYDRQGVYALIEAWPKLPRPPLHGKDASLNYTLDLKAIFNGRTLKLRHFNHALHRDLSDQEPIKIPPGMKDQQQFRFPGLGYPGTDGGKDGDLTLTFNHHLPDHLSIDGDQIIIRVLSPQALLDAGGTINASFQGQNFEVRVTAGSHTGDLIPVLKADELPEPWQLVAVQLLTTQSLEEADPEDPGSQSATFGSGTLPAMEEAKPPFSLTKMLITTAILIPGLIGVGVLGYFIYQMTQTNEHIPSQASTASTANLQLPPSSSTDSEPEHIDTNHITPPSSDAEQPKLEPHQILESLAWSNYGVRLNAKDYASLELLNDAYDRIEMAYEIKLNYGVKVNYKDYKNFEEIQILESKLLIASRIQKDLGVTVDYKEFATLEELEDFERKLELEKQINEKYGLNISHENFFSASSMKDAMQRMEYQKQMKDQHSIELRYTDYTSAEAMKKAIDEMGYELKEQP